MDFLAGFNKIVEEKERAAKIDKESNVALIREKLGKYGDASSLAVDPNEVDGGLVLSLRGKFGAGGENKIRFWIPRKQPDGLKTVHWRLSWVPSDGVLETEEDEIELLRWIRFGQKELG